MVYSFRCEYAKTRAYMHNYASKHARAPARVGGRIVRKYPAEKWGMLPSWRELRRLIRPRLAAFVGWLQSLADGMHVGCYPPRVNRESVAALVVCVQDNKQESAQDNVCSVGVLRLLSMRRANICNSMAVPLYALRLYVTRCIYGGIYGRTYGALSFAHGIG